ncbi:MAG: VWA domain-containing protein [Pirellulales bacterium]|nr:VWA domain-containing protein [Pirellulales bacterium]
MSARRLLQLDVFMLAIALLLLPAGASMRAAEAGKPLSPDEKAKALEENVTQGALRATRKDGGMVECPLRHTDVGADISGFIARVKVTQTFYNPTDERIEAVYVFPLPHEAAIDDMTMVVGDRKIVGLIKRRAEARQVYEEALAAGQTAALLEQERPNIFTQSVGNIDPGQEVNIEIHYVDVLNYDKGTYEFHFPMVVGPRFIPGSPVNPPAPTPPELQGKVSPPVPDTPRVPDASRISPPVLKPGFRNGHDISLSLRLDAGVPIQDFKVVNHEAKTERDGETRATVKLLPNDTIPNKDFLLRYYVVGKKPEMAVLSHTGNSTDAKRLGRGYFMLMVQPKEDERLTKSPPREIVFLLDVSGSMSGQPTEKVKEAMREMLKLCREIDTVQVITFASQTQQLFDKPAPINKENVTKALNFTEGIRGSGGTYMLEGVKRAIDQPIDKERVRIVIMLTDGYIGNEAEIVEHVGKSCGDQIRFWAIGIGSSPNMFLIDGVARQGGGMGKRLALEEPAAGLSEEVISRIQRAQLSKIRIDWGGLDVAETYPSRIPELWAGRPVILFGRYRGGGPAEIRLAGVVEGEPVQWPLKVTLPENQPAHDVLAKVWARKKIEDLMQQTFYAGSPAVEEEVTAIALDYRLMSQYTSFVAVDAKDAEKIDRERSAQPPRRMLVPVPLPEGTRWEGFFGPLGETPAEGLDLAVAPARKLAEAKGKVQRRDFAFSAPSSGPGLAMGMGGGGIRGRMAPGMPMAQPAAGALPGMAPPPAPLAAKPMNAPLNGAPRQQYLLSRGMPGYFRGQRGDVQLNRNARYASPAPPGLVLGLPIASYGAAARESLAGERELDRLAVIADQYTAGAVSADAPALVQASQEYLEAGRKAMQAKKPTEARASLLRACFLAAAAVNRGNYEAVALSNAALSDLESLHADRVSAWKKEMPALGTKLDLVLRDLPVEEALDAIAKAAGLKARLVPGSVDDASEMLAGRRARTTYLDLRGATAAQALDWLLQPLRLAWSKADGDDPAIVVGSDRRLPHVSGWVYDVAAIALPLPKELGDAKDPQKLADQAKQSAGQFVGAVRNAADASEKEVMWFAPGQLLVFGMPRTHEKAAALLAVLSNPEAKPASDLATLHETTSRRAKERKEEIQKLAELSRLLEAAGAHDEFAWKLLAAALGGELDREALTELQIAWKSGATKELLEGEAQALALRSAWAITLAWQMLPGEKELATLADSVRRQCRPALEKAITLLKEKPQDAEALLAAAYAALASDGADLKQQVLTSLGAEPAGLVFAVRSLLDEPGKIDREQLTKLVATGSLAREDAVVMAALACRRDGGETWTSFRAEMRELLGRQPLPGSVVVLVNRLSGNIPLAALRR